MSHRKRPASGEPRRPVEDADRKRGRSGSAVPAGRGSQPPSFPSYLDTGPGLHPKVRLLCEILATASPPSALERFLDDAGIRGLSTEDVESVLKLSYSHPSAAVGFFRWARSRHLGHRISPYSWNLVVDLLGKNRLFDAAWDTVRSMRSEGILSLATFASFFSSLAAAGRPDDAFTAFETMEKYGVPRDSAALNTLISAFCRESRVSAARLMYDRSRGAAPPDADTFAILLEGCENEVDHRAAREVFDDMIATVGWDPSNVAAYDSFLTTLILSGSRHCIDDATRSLSRMARHRCFPGVKFFRNAVKVFVEKEDADGALIVWEELLGRNGCIPDTLLYNSMISLLCSAGHMNRAVQFLDEMVFYGAFPDSRTYNILLHFLLKELRRRIDQDKLREAVSIVNEMIKNHFYPDAEDCESLIKILVDDEKWEMAEKLWKLMVENKLPSLEECGNAFVTMLQNRGRLPEACTYAEDMIDRGIKVSYATLSKLKQSLLRIGKVYIHDKLLQKLKLR